MEELAVRLKLTGIEELQRKVSVAFADKPGGGISTMTSKLKDAFKGGILELLDRLSELFKPVLEILFLLTTGVFVLEFLSKILEEFVMFLKDFLNTVVEPLFKLLRFVLAPLMIIAAVLSIILIKVLLPVIVPLVKLLMGFVKVIVGLVTGKTDIISEGIKELIGGYWELAEGIKASKDIWEKQIPENFAKALDLDGLVTAIKTSLGGITPEFKISTAEIDWSKIFDLSKFDLSVLDLSKLDLSKLDTSKISLTIEAAKEEAKKVVDAIIPPETQQEIQTKAQGVFDQIASGLNYIIEKIGIGLENVWLTLQDALNYVVEKVGIGLENVWLILQDAFAIIAENIGNIWSTILLPNISAIANWFVENALKFVDAINSLYSWFTTNVSRFIQGLTNMQIGIDNIVQFFASLKQRMEQAVSGASSGVIGTVGGIVSGAVSAVSSFIPRQIGGYIPTTGYYKLHAGEYVNRAGAPIGATVIMSNTFNLDVNSDVDVDRLVKTISEKLHNEFRGKNIYGAW